MTVISKFFCTKAREMPGMAGFRDWLKKQMEQQVKPAENYDAKVRVDLGKEVILKIQHSALERYHKLVIIGGLFGAGAYYLGDYVMAVKRDMREEDKFAQDIESSKLMINIQRTQLAQLKRQEFEDLAKEKRDKEKFVQDMESLKLMIKIQRIQLAQLERQELEDRAKNPPKK